MSFHRHRFESSLHAARAAGNIVSLLRFIVVAHAHDGTRPPEPQKRPRTTGFGGASLRTEPNRRGYVSDLTLPRRDMMFYPQSVPSTRLESLSVDWSVLVSAALVVSIASIVAMIFVQ